MAVCSTEATRAGAQLAQLRHDLRHTFGSQLVRHGADVVTVCRQMGHARPSTTVDVYSHEFAGVQHRDSVASRLTDAFSGLLAGAGNQWIWSSVGHGASV